MKKNDYLKMLLAGLSGAVGCNSATDTAADIQHQLECLANSLPRINLFPSAMCYSVCRSSLDTTPLEYVCPVCNQKTLYERDFNMGGWNEFLLERLLPEYRQGMKELADIAPASLDEIEFCEHCAKVKVDTPRIFIIFRHADGKVKRTPLATSDIEILTAFFKGERKVDYGAGGEGALKDEVSRLAELLGVPVFADTVRERQRLWYENKERELRSAASIARHETWDLKQKNNESDTDFRKRETDAYNTVEEQLDADLKQAKMESREIE